MAVLESNNKYDHFDYYTGGITGLTGVLKNTADLLKRNAAYLTTDNWIDVTKIGSLKVQSLQDNLVKYQTNQNQLFLVNLTQLADFSLRNPQNPAKKNIFYKEIQYHMLESLFWGLENDYVLLYFNHFAISLHYVYQGNKKNVNFRSKSKRINEVYY